MKRHALFVGVNEYSDDTIHDLSFAVSDATDLAGFFKHKADFDRSEVLVNPKDANAVLNKAADLLNGLGAGDEFLFFFAGHGITTQDGHRLVCTTDKLQEVRRGWSGLPLARLKFMTRSTCDRLFIFDACRSDVFAGNRGDGGAKMEEGTRDLILGTDDMPEGDSDGALTILCSCDDGQCAGEIPSLKHGIFSQALLDLLEEGKNSGSGVVLSDDFVYKFLPEHMDALAKRAEMDCIQKPQKRGPGIMLLGATEPVGQMRIVCPACGKNNRLDATFKCRVCGRENLCLEHRQKETGLCKDCADKVKKAKSWLKKVLEDDMKLCGRCAECLDGEHGEEVRRGVLELCLVYSELAADDLAGQTATKLLRAVCAPLGEIDDLKKTVNDLKKQVDAAKASLHENPDPSTLKTSSVKAVVPRPLTRSERVRIKTAMNAITPSWRERPEISGPADELAAAGSDAEALEAIRKMECAIRCDFEGENSGVARLKRLPALFRDIAVLNSSAPTSSPSGVDRALESLFAMERVYCAHIMIG